MRFSVCRVPSFNHSFVHSFMQTCGGGGGGAGGGIDGSVWHVKREVCVRYFQESILTVIFAARPNEWRKYCKVIHGCRHFTASSFFFTAAHCHSLKFVFYERRTRSKIEQKKKTKTENRNEKNHHFRCALPSKKLSHQQPFVHGNADEDGNGWREWCVRCLAQNHQINLFRWIATTNENGAKQSLTGPTVQRPTSVRSKQ